MMTFLMTGPQTTSALLSLPLSIWTENLVSSSTSQQPASILPMYWFSVQRYWIALSFAETKVSNFSLRPKVWSAEREVMLNLVGDQSIKPNHFYFCSSKCKQIRHEWRRSLGRCNNRHGPKAENFKFSFLHLPVRRDDRSETWFKTFCILIRSQSKVWDWSQRKKSPTAFVQGLQSRTRFLLL